MICYRKILVTLFVTSLFAPNLLQAGSSLIIRPQVGYGRYDSSTLDDTGSIYHYGARVMLGAGETQRYGLEISRFEAEDDSNFLVFGIMLAEKFWGWLNASIGTVGYFNYIDNSNNPIGLVSNVGWEPDWDKRIKPYITYRNDTIFAKKTDSIYSISFGASLSF